MSAAAEAASWLRYAEDGYKRTEARRLGVWGMLAGIDQLRAGIADYRDTALREAGVIPDGDAEG